MTGVVAKIVLNRAKQSFSPNAVRFTAKDRRDIAEFTTRMEKVFPLNLFNAEVDPVVQKVLEFFAWIIEEIDPPPLDDALSWLNDIAGEFRRMARGESEAEQVRVCYQFCHLLEQEIAWVCEVACPEEPRPSKWEPPFHHVETH